VENTTACRHAGRQAGRGFAALRLCRDSGAMMCTSEEEIRNYLDALEGAEVRKKSSVIVRQLLL
jgi:hypothetical protein